MTSLELRLEDGEFGSIWVDGLRAGWLPGDIAINAAGAHAVASRWRQTKPVMPFSSEYVRELLKESQA